MKLAAGRLRAADMTLNRRPTAFGDLRGWIDALRKAGELHEVDAEVSIDFEIGTIMRLAQGPGTGPAMLFNNLKGYNKPTSRCRRIFGSALNNNRRIAMMLGLEPDTHARELVKLGRTILQDSSRRASSRPAPARRTSSPARMSISPSFRRRTGTGSTAAAISSPMPASSPRTRPPT